MDKTELMTALGEALGPVKSSMDQVKTLEERIGQQEKTLADYNTAIEDLKKQNKSLEAASIAAERRMLETVMTKSHGREPGTLSSDKSCKAFADLAMCLAGKEDARKRCESEHGFVIKGMTESAPTGGGILVPGDLRAEVIALVSNYGTLRQNARVVPMARDTQDWPVRNGGLTVYAPGEAGTVTASAPTFTAVNLVAKKLMTLCAISSELEEDAAIAIGAYVADEIARAHAKAEDDAGYLGDGSATYWNFTGIKNALAAGSKVTSADHNLASEQDMSDFAAVAGALPDWADTADTAWYCSRWYYYNAMVYAAMSAGGATALEVSQNVMRTNKTFLGYPVRWYTSMPTSDANTQINAILGDMRQSVLLGDRRQLDVVRSNEVYFTSDQIGIRSRERVDIVCHSVGTASVAGGLIAMVSYSS